jgi:predicted XRE-type DNA-binding protein
LVGSSNRIEESKMNALQIERQLVFSRLSRKMRGDFSNLLEGKLMACLNRLGYDIDIKVRPASETIGHLRLAIA